MLEGSWEHQTSHKSLAQCDLHDSILGNSKSALHFLKTGKECRVVKELKFNATVLCCQSPKTELQDKHGTFI